MSDFLDNLEIYFTHRKVVLYEEVIAKIVRNTLIVLYLDSFVEHYVLNKKRAECKCLHNAMYIQFKSSERFFIAETFFC